MKKDSIGSRMKNNYESRFATKLMRRTPVIIRLDGKAFHTLTRDCEKPFDRKLKDAMEKTTCDLCKGIQGAKCAYTQSDEISILLVDYDKLTTEAWFDYDVQKIVSVSAAIASTSFTKHYSSTGLFDSRAFNIPREEVCNYFIWRQQDWMRNSIQMLARNHFSDKELHKKNTRDMHEMLYTVGVNWAELEQVWKNGSYTEKEFPDQITHNITFNDQRYKIEKHLQEEQCQS